MSMMGTDEQLSARRIITDYLDRYGLGGLDDFVYNLVFRENVVSEAQLKTKIRETEVYRERFRGNEERREAGLNVYSEDRYIELENQYRYYRGLSGMPEGFYDSNDDIANFIANDVSPDEYYARINEGYSAVRNADPEVVGELQRLYGVNDSDLTLSIDAMIALPSRFSYFALIPPIAIGRSCILGDQYSYISVLPLSVSSALCPNTHRLSIGLSAKASFNAIALCRALLIV